LQTRETECTGRLAQFEHNGDLSGYTNFRDFWHLPDKNRTEYEVKGAKGGFLGVLIGQIPFKGGTIIELFNGDEGWTMDKSGVSEQPSTAITDFKEQTKRDMDNVLRFPAERRRNAVSLRRPGLGGYEAGRVGRAGGPRRAHVFVWPCYRIRTCLRAAS